MAAPTLLPMKIIYFEKDDEIEGKIYMDAGIV